MFLTMPAPRIGWSLVHLVLRGDPDVFWVLGKEAREKSVTQSARPIDADVHAALGDRSASGARPGQSVRAMGTRRLLCVGLLGLSLGMLSAPAPSELSEDASLSLAAQVAGVRAATTAAQIDDVLHNANPGLADHERRRIGAALIRSANRYELAPELVLAVILVESGARPEASSPKGALGLMQVMPHMMTPLALAGNAMTVESNIEAGCFILSDNIRRWGFEKGISAYFWGGHVRDGRYLAKVLKARERVREILAS